MLRTLTVALVALLLLVGQAPSPPPPGFERVTFPSTGAGGATLDGYLKRPADGRAPAAAVVGLHGCGGLFTRSGKLAERETDWAERWSAAGYAVLLPDSFNPRGYRQICTLKADARTIRPLDRAADAAAAIGWLAGQPFIDARRIALVGWSHGGSSTLRAVAKGFTIPGAEVRTAIAFYPGCRPMAESTTWATRVPLTILIGSEDDWTPPETCRSLGQRPGVTLVEYAGAVHGFDAPNTTLRVRTDVGLTKSGTAKVGTDPKARAAAIAEVTRLLDAALR